MLLTLFYGGLAVLLLGIALSAAGLNGGKRLRKTTFLLYGAALTAILAFSASAFYENQRVDVFSYSILPGIPLSFAVDRLSAFFIGLISLVSLGVSIYSIGYVEHGAGVKRKNILAALMGLFIFSMLLVVSSTSTFAFLFFWEMMSLSSFLLVLYEYEKPQTTKAALFYFTMTQLSTVFLLAGFFGLYTITGSFQMVPVADASPLSVTVVFLCLFTGFAIKGGVVPFHKWLPYAHAQSPSNISALMSGVMLKVAVYGLIRFTIDVLGPVDWWGFLILFFGTLSAILGIIYALKEHDIKRLLAYSSIENVGTILIGFGLYVIFATHGLTALADIALAGSLLHALNHGVFKGLLFMSAGSVVNASGTRDIEEMGGLIKRMPYTAGLFLIGALAISALPPLNGFVSEYLIFQAFFGAAALTDNMLKVLLILSLSVFALTSAFVAACFVKAFGITFLGLPRTEGCAKAKEAEKAMLYGPGILAAVCILIGLFSQPLLAAMGYESNGLPDLFFVGMFLLATYAGAWTALYYYSPKKESLGETWDCGSNLSSRTEYTACGFSQPITRIFSTTYRTKEILERKFFDKSATLFKNGSGRIDLLKFFEEYLYLPVAKRVMGLSARVARLQNWNLDTYIAYAFIAVLAVVVYVGWFI